MDKIRKQFPVVNQYIYADTAATGLLSEDLLEWRQGHDLDYLIGGSLMKMHANQMIQQTREIVCDFFGANTNETVLVPSFTIGLNLLLEGLSSKEKVLLLEGDYPSLNRPFESRKFQINYVPINEDLETNIYESIRANKSTVLALSMVQWLNGLKVNFEFLNRLKQEFPALLIITDGTQFLGTSDFNFAQSPIDVMGASAYKWLLSGFGNGLLLVKDHCQHRFQIKSHGYGSGRNTNAELHQRTFVKRLEAGHLDTLNFGSLQYALGFLKTIGMKKIEHYLDGLALYAKEKFSELGLLDDLIVSRKVHSTIFNIKGNQAVFETLTQENVLCSQRGDGIRLSFHFYNTVNEIDSIVNILRK